MTGGPRLSARGEADVRGHAGSERVRGAGWVIFPARWAQPRDFPLSNFFSVKHYCQFDFFFTNIFIWKILSGYNTLIFLEYFWASLPYFYIAI